MRRKKHQNEGHNDSHRWVISYADFITLLFAFFVVMYAISSVNVSKYKSLSEGMNSAFNKKDRAHAKVSKESIYEGRHASDVKGVNKAGFDSLNQSLSTIEDDEYKINRQDGWIEIDINAGALFELGSADLKPAALTKLLKIATVLKDMPYPVVLEGYTDNIPINTPQFPSNWELSAARAAAIARALNQFGVAGERLVVIGFGERFPVASNATEFGRNRNRRVNIVIARDNQVPRLMNPAIDEDDKLLMLEKYLHVEDTTEDTQ